MIQPAPTRYPQRLRQRVSPWLGAVALLCALLLGSPLVARADDRSSGLWAHGVQIGLVEMGAHEGVSPPLLSRALRLARAAAAQSGCLNPAELDPLIEAMDRARDSRSLHGRITAYRQRVAAVVQSGCSCGSGASASAAGGDPIVGCYAFGNWVGTLTVRREGATLRGTYGRNSASTMVGRLEGDVWTGTYVNRQTNSRGEFRLTFSRDRGGERIVTGTWRQTVSPHGTGDWGTGRRRPCARP